MMKKYDYNSNPQGVAEIKSKKRDDNLSRVIEIINEKLKKRDKIKVYEPGCGGGRNLEFLKKKYGKAIEIYGTDISQTSIRYIRKRIPGNFAISKTVNDYFNEEFDLIIMLDILEHLPSLEEVEGTIRLAKKRLSNEGVLFISCPLELNRYSIMWVFKKINFWSDVTLKYYGHTIQFSEEILLEIISKYFKIEKKFYGTHFFSQLDTFLFFYLPKQSLRFLGGEKAVSSFRESNIEMDCSKDSNSMFKKILLKTYFVLRAPFLFAGYYESKNRKNSKFGAMNVSLECCKNNEK